MDLQALTFVGAVVAIVGSLLGAILAIDQLTASYRYRRSAEFLRATLASDTLQPAQREILRSVHSETVGRILATSAVPTWGLWSDLVLILLAGALSFLLGWVYLGLHHAMTAESVALWLPVLFAIAFCWWGFRHGLFVLRERARLTRAYLRGRQMLHANGLWSLMRDRRGAWLATALTFGFLTGVAGTAATFASHEPEWTSGVPFSLGFSVLLIASREAKKYVEPRPNGWIHPEPKAPLPTHLLPIRVRFWHRPRSFWFKMPEDVPPPDSE